MNKFSVTSKAKLDIKLNFPLIGCILVNLNLNGKTWTANQIHIVDKIRNSKMHDGSDYVNTRMLPPPDNKMTSARVPNEIVLANFVPIEKDYSHGVSCKILLEIRGLFWVSHEFKNKFLNSLVKN